MPKAQSRPRARPRVSSADEPVASVILRVAVQLFMAHGYEATTVDQVALSCHVTKASVYNYYSSKAGLFANAMLRTMETVRHRSHSLLAAGGSLQERLEVIASSRLQYRDSRWDLDTMVREAGTALSPNQVQELKQVEAQVMDTLIDAFRVSVNFGEIRNVDPAFTAHAYVSLLEGCRARTLDGELKFPDVQMAAKMVVATLWYGLDPGHPESV